MTTTPKKLRSRTRSNSRGTLQPTRNDANDGILSYTPLPVSLSSWSSFKLSFAERSNVHGLPFPVPNEPTDFWTLSQQTQSELDPSDGWDDPVDEIHSYVTRGTFWSLRKAARYRCQCTVRFLQQSEKATGANFDHKREKRSGHIKRREQ